MNMATGRQMKWVLPKVSRVFPLVLVLLMTVAVLADSQDQMPSHAGVSASGTRLAQFLNLIRVQAKVLENSSGTRVGFRMFTSAHTLPPEIVMYSAHGVARLLFEATRDAGFWTLPWSITDKPPNSDNIWRQWQNVKTFSALAPTATAECDELSALYAFLVERAGVRGVGLFWAAANHTVAVWVLHPA